MPTERNQKLFKAVLREKEHLQQKNPNLWAVLQRFILKASDDGGYDWLRAVPNSGATGLLVNNFTARRYNPRKRMRKASEGLDEKRQRVYDRADAVLRYHQKKERSKVEATVRHSAASAHFKKVLMVRRKRWVFEFIRSFEKAGATAEGALGWMLQTRVRAPYAEIYTERREASGLPSNPTLEKVGLMWRQATRSPGVIAKVGASTVWPKTEILRPVGVIEAGVFGRAIAQLAGHELVSTSSSGWRIVTRPLMMQDSTYRFRSAYFADKLTGEEVPYTVSQAAPAKYRYVKGSHVLEIPCQMAVGPAGDIAIWLCGRSHKIAPASGIPGEFFLTVMSSEFFAMLIYGLAKLRTGTAKEDMPSAVVSYLSKIIDWQSLEV